MAKETDEQAAGVTESAAKGDLCGLILPISETANHSEQHWADVQALLHRAIKAAGFTPQNVWESTSTDRISERIIGNIFQVPMAVADISDLNPNVMLELGLRLASKKPTIVIINAGSPIPFDIRDFQVLHYPPDLNILGMEEFFRRLTKLLQDRAASYRSENYVPFLGNVIVDVATPETREVTFNELLVSRLDVIATRLSALESASIRPKLASGRPVRAAPNRMISGSVFYEVSSDRVGDFINEIVGDLWEVDSARVESASNGISRVQIEFSASTRDKAISQIDTVAEKYGAEEEIPF